MPEPTAPSFSAFHSNNNTFKVRSKLKRYEINEETTPNYQFASWLKEWYEEAATRDSKLQFAYRKALDSMMKWPDKLRNGREAGKLPGIGPSISTKLDEKLADYNRSHGIVTEIPDGTVLINDEYINSLAKTKKEVKSAKKRKSKSTTTETGSNRNMTDEDELVSDNNPKKKKSKKEYVPSYRSGPYSLLIALFLHLHKENTTNENSCLSKVELIRSAQTYSTSSLSDGMFPAINGALKILEEKELIGKFGSPPHFALTETGLVLAEKLWQKGEKRASQAQLPQITPSKLFRVEPISERPDKVNNNKKAKTLTSFTWPEGSFEIILLVDVREIRSREDRNYLTDRLTQLGIKNELRNLELGDFLWIARRSKKSGDFIIDSEEIVLDTLIERKREDDLCSSLTDGRFKEQKHRISKCLLKSTFYLVERGSSGSCNDLIPGGEERILAATLQCQISDNLMYRQTGGLEESITFLQALHNSIKKRFASNLTACLLDSANFSFNTFPTQFESLKQIENNENILLNYTAYSLLNSKTCNQSSTDTFLQQLMTIHGVTYDKALLILHKYPTALTIFRAYRELPNELAKEEFFKSFKGGDNTQKPFGLSLSKKIYQVFGR